MKLASDKIQHLKGGAIVALAMLAIVAIGLVVGLQGGLLPGLAAGVAAGSVGVAIGLELYQRVRKEGEPSWQDAAASAVPGLVLAAALLAASS